MTTFTPIAQKRANLADALFENITEHYPSGMRETLADDRAWGLWLDATEQLYCVEAVAEEPTLYSHLTCKCWKQLRARSAAYFAEVAA